MKAGVLVILTVVCLVGNLRSSTGDHVHQCEDPKLVRSWVDMPLGEPEGVWFIEKSVYRSGDRIALGIMQGFTQDELRDSARLEKILALIRLSFSQPSLISYEEDRNPRATLILLYFLEHEFKEGELRQKVLDTEKYVSDQTEGRRR